MYALAVGGVILAVDLVLAGLYAWSVDWPHAGPEFTWMMRMRFVPGSLYLWGAAGTALVIFAVSGWNVMQLSSGGKAVAEMVNARRIDSGTRDPLERRLVNVVEEMAIASGVRVPAVYVMDGEPGINAFAAGFQQYAGTQHCRRQQRPRHGTCAEFFKQYSDIGHAIACAAVLFRNCHAAPAQFRHLLPNAVHKRCGFAVELEQHVAAACATHKIARRILYQLLGVVK